MRLSGDKNEGRDLGERKRSKGKRNVTARRKRTEIGNEGMSA